MTDFNTCLVSVSVLSFLLFQNSMYKDMCVSVCV